MRLSRSLLRPHSTAEWRDELGGRGHHGQDEVQRTALPFHALDPHTSAVVHHIFMHDMQPQPRAARLRADVADALERPEQVGLSCRGDADALVAHTHTHIGGGPREVCVDGSSL